MRGETHASLIVTCSWICFRFQPKLICDDNKTPQYQISWKSFQRVLTSFMCSNRQMYARIDFNRHSTGLPTRLKSNSAFFSNKQVAAMPNLIEAKCYLMLVVVSLLCTDTVGRPTSFCKLSCYLWHQLKRFHHFPRSSDGKPNIGRKGYTFSFFHGNCV
jgi:hypothetical protein